MEEKYTRYGIDWQNEVMKNHKMMIVQMLRRVAMERDKLRATCNMSSRFIDTGEVIMKNMKVFVDGVETKDYQLIGNAILLPSRYKDGWFWHIISKISFLRKYAYKPEQLITVIYDACNV